MLYTPIRSDRAADLSAAIQNIFRPPHKRNQADVARYKFSWIDHPSDNGWSVLLIPEEMDLPIHVEADGALLAEVLSVFLSDGRITQEEFDGLVQAVPALAGTTVNVAALIPPSWQAQVMDRAGAIAAGFIVEEESAGV